MNLQDNPRVGEGNSIAKRRARVKAAALIDSRSTVENVLVVGYSSMK
jgi:hypothetical protein